MSVYVAPLYPTANASAVTGAGTYATQRNLTTATTTPGVVTGYVGQRYEGGPTNLGQYFLTFDTSAIPAGTTSATLSIAISTAATSGTDTLEVRQVSSATNMIAGDSLAAQPLLGSLAIPTTAVRISIPLDITSMARASGTILLIHSQRQRIAATAATDTAPLLHSLTAAVGNRPYLDYSPKPWTFVGVSAIGTPVTATPIILTEPAGVADGDLLIACIASRTTATTAITGTGWTAVGSQNNNNILTTTSALASGTMLYRIRSGTPTLSLTLPATVSVAMGQIVAYRGNAATTPLDASTAATTAVNTLAVSVTGLTTTQDDDLIVAMAAGGQEASWTAFTNVTTPLTASGATDTTTAPSATAWIERADTISGAGADTSLGIFDAVRASTGPTGNLTVTAQQGAGHVIIAGAFKITRQTADAWNDADGSAGITLSNSDRTATNSVAAIAGVRSTTTLNNGTAGKYYAEFVMGSAVPANVGITPTSNALTAQTVNFSIATFDGGARINNVANVVTLGACVANDVVCVAWDTGAEQVWFRRNADSWNAAGGSADPASGAGGLDCSFAAATPHALWARFGSSTGNSTTIRTKLAQYTQAVPSSFSSWMGETPAGGGVTVSATGVAAGTALGTVTVDAVAPVSFEAVGVAATTALGTATATGKTNISTVATGVTATALTGTATVNTIWNVSATSTGMTAGTALGTATATGVASASTTPTGQSAAAALGNASVAAGGAVSVIPGGVTALAVTGTATVSVGVNVNVTPTGVAAAAVTASGATAPSSSLIASFTPGPNRNDFTGEVGVRWGIGAADIPITWMGMYVTTTGGTRTVRLYEWFGDTVLRTVVFDFTGKTPGTWVWQPITPITLVAGGYYSALHSVTASDGLAWADALAPGAVTSVAGIVNTYATYRAGGAQTAYAPDIEYVGLDLGSGASGAGGVVVTIASTTQAAGAAAATALGTATVTANRSASVTPTGVSATTALGGVSIAVGGGISITPSSLTVTALSGTATVAAQQQISTLAAGASATALSGTAGVSVRTSTAAAGVTAAALVGAATVTAKQAVTTAATGVTASTALGGVSVAAGGSIGVIAAGQSATALTGTATATAKRFVSVAASGVTAATGYGVVTVTTTVVVAANTVGVWTGSVWAQKPAKVWTGSAWMAKPVKTWNGGAWV